MNGILVRRAFLVLGLLCTSFSAARAQSAADKTCEFGAHYFGFNGVPLGAPFWGAARETQTSIQPDGTSVTGANNKKLARDSKGRSYSEISLGTALISWQIGDPSKHNFVSWHHDSSYALLYRDPRFVVTDKGSVPWETLSAEWSVEPLGTKMIHGVLTEGVRATRTCQVAGPNTGRSRTMYGEWWYSRDLQLVLSEMLVSPRSGTIEEEFLELKREEPDPRLFSAPPNYVVEDKGTVAP